MMAIPSLNQKILLSRCENLFQISRPAIQKAIDEMVAAKVIVVEPDWQQ